MVAARTQPPIAFVVVVLTNAAYFGGVFWVAPDSASTVIPAFLATTVIVAPIGGSALIQHKLTKGHGTKGARKIELALAAIFGPYIGLWVFWLTWLTLGGAL